MLLALRKRIFSTSEASPSASEGDRLVDEILQRAKPIRRQVEDYVEARQIPVLHFATSCLCRTTCRPLWLLYNLAVEWSDIGFVMQHHDIYWEGPNAKNFLTPHQQINDLMDRIMCPALPNGATCSSTLLPVRRCGPGRALSAPSFPTGSTSIGT
jgi:hypothetical protein